jgi:hypothetical protein
MSAVGKIKQTWKLYMGSIRLAARSKAWTVFARSNASIVGSNPTKGMDVCLRLLCLYRQRPCDWLSPRPRSPTGCLRITELKWKKAFQGCPILQSGSNREERERDNPYSIIHQVPDNISDICHWCSWGWKLDLSRCVLSSPPPSKPKGNLPATRQKQGLR